MADKIELYLSLSFIQKLKKSEVPDKGECHCVCDILFVKVKIKIELWIKTSILQQMTVSEYLSVKIFYCFQL